MANTSDRILDYLKTHSNVTAKEMSAVFGLTLPDIRYQLKELLVARKIDVQKKANPVSRGRPTHLYNLSRASAAYNTSRLTQALLEVLKEIGNPQLLDEILKKTAEKIVYQASPMPGKLGLRLNSTIRKLNELHYQARWEASPMGPRICLGHCPYPIEPGSQDMLCTLDRDILETLLDIPVTQTTQRVVGSDGPTTCIFLLSLPK